MNARLNIPPLKLPCKQHDYVDYLYALRKCSKCGELQLKSNTLPDNQTTLIIKND